MKTLLLSILLLLPLTSYSNNFFKTKENALACQSYDVINTIINTSDTNKDQAYEMLSFALDQDACVISRKDIIVKLIDFKDDIYKVNVLEIGLDVWIHKNQLYR